MFYSLILDPVTLKKYWSLISYKQDFIAAKFSLLYYHLACTQIMFWVVTTSVYQVLMMQYNIQKLNPM